MAKSKPHNQGMPKKARIPAPARSGRRVRYSVAMSLDGFVAELPVRAGMWQRETLCNQKFLPQADIGAQILETQHVDPP